tara:strand:- start:1637 stop:2440 length:804 start_codon:yes stop_codon:yes gene_type:complete
MVATRKKAKGKSKLRPIHKPPNRYTRSNSRLAFNLKAASNSRAASNLMKKPIISLTELRKEYFNGLIYLKAALPIPRFVINNFSAIAKTIPKNTSHGYEDKDIIKILTSVLNDIYSKKDILYTPGVLKNFSAKPDEVPDVMKRLSNLWILEHLLEEPSKIETKFTLQSVIPSNIHIDESSLRKEIIQSYKKYVFDNIHIDDSSKTYWVTIKKWDIWPCKPVWENYIVPKGLPHTMLYLKEAEKQRAIHNARGRKKTRRRKKGKKRIK